MRAPILVINAGSSSIKFSLFETAAAGEPVAGPHGQVTGIGADPKLDIAGSDDERPIDGRDHDAAIAAILGWLEDHVGDETGLVAAGHRIVHGGARFTAPVLIDDDVLAALDGLVPLAPLHQPHNLAAIRAIRTRAPDLPQVACFDTAFHHDQPALAQRLALPRHLSERGIRRYGFHGLSYEYIVGKLPELAPPERWRRLVVAHLGNGASLCALAEGKPVATTMGFSTLDGLVMGTRPGLLDPGVILYLLKHEKMSADAIERLLYEESGLEGMSGHGHDMRDLLASDDPSAREAVALFVYRAGRELGSMAAALGGLDALVFTGGIGEHAAPIRAGIAEAAGWLGVRLDRAANDQGGPVISTPNSAILTLVVPTDEDLMIARHTRAVIGATG